MRYVTVGLVLFLALVAPGNGRAAHAQAPATDIKAVVAAYQKAFAAGDLDATFAFFDENVAANDLGTVSKGKAEFIAQTLKALQQFPGISVSFGEPVFVLNTVIGRVAVAADPLRAAGISRIWIVETVVISQGKIISFTDALDLTDAETLRFAMASAGR